MTVLQSLLSRFRRDRTVGSRRRLHGQQHSSSQSCAAESLEARLLLTNPDLYDSLPGAPVTIYLDFDGYTETDNAWTVDRRDNGTGDIVTPAFDVDSDPTTFNQEERDRISEIYERVAEDFRPFNINVTTVEPAAFQTAQDLLVSIGGDGSWTSTDRYAAIPNSFGSAGPRSVFVFQTDHNGLGGGFQQNVAASVSQAVAISMGLQVHQDGAGNPLEGDANVAPILGDQIVGANGNINNVNSTRDIWFNASIGATIQDDLASLAGNPNVTFRTDDYGNTDQSATAITIGPGDETITGLIETNTDRDVFSFVTAATTATVSITGLDLRPRFSRANTPGSNLDPLITLRDADGNVLASDDGTGLTSTLTQTLPDGRYYIEVSNKGEYGNLGEYTITLSGVDSLPPFANPVALSSKPDAPVTFYLAFAGGVVPDTHPIVANRVDGGMGQIAVDAFDTDGVGTFSAAEVDQIIEIYERVAEDFAPFDVNVTTVSPGAPVTGESIAILIGGTDAFAPTEGYLATLGSFTDANVPNLGLTLSENIQSGAATDGQHIAFQVSATIANILGLGAHPDYAPDGSVQSPFDPGNSAVGPILGAPFNSLRDIWVDAAGTVDDATFQDDLALITDANLTGIVYRADDYADSALTALPIAIGAGTEVIHGIIETVDDVDVFRVDTLATVATISVKGLDLTDDFAVPNPGSNLDPVLEILDSLGRVVGISDIPVNFLTGPQGLTASITQNLPAGTYFIRVSNRNEYGNLGKYTLSIDGIDAVPLTVTIAPSTFSETDGFQAGVGTVSRPAGTSAGTSDIVVNLESSDTSEVTVTPQVTIPAGVQSVTFDINIVDDTLLDGDQRVSIQARVAGVINNQAFVTVTDHETVDVSVTPNPVREDAGTASLTVSRSNTDVDAPNHFVTVNNQIREYTPAGVLVNTIPVPWPTGVRPAGEIVHDVTVLRNGLIAVFNGSGNAALSIYNPSNMSWQHFGPVAELSGDAADTTVGGLASFGDYVFLSDSETIDGDARGMVRINLITGDIDRFAGETVGARLFALNSGRSSTVHEINPASGALLNTFLLPEIQNGTGVRYTGESIAFDGTNLWVEATTGTSGFQELLKVDPNTGTLLDNFSLASSQFFFGIGGIAYLDGLIYMKEDFGIDSDIQVFSPELRTVLPGVRPINNQTFSAVFPERYLGSLPGTGSLIVSETGLTDTIYEFNANNGIITSQFAATNNFRFNPGITSVSDVRFGDTVFNDLIYLGTASDEISIFTRSGQRVDTDPTTPGVDDLAVDVRFTGDLAGADVPGVTSLDLEFRDVTVGFDGLVYGLTTDGLEISVHDPETLIRLRGITLERSVRTISVGDSSGIYAGTTTGEIVAFDFDGAIQSVLSTGLGVIANVEVNVGQELIASDAAGTVILTNQTAVLASDASQINVLENVGGTAFATFGRHPTRSTGDLIVNLQSSDLTEFRVPDSVIIPAGQQSITLTVEVVDDNERDGDQTVTITANSSEYTSGSTDVIVEDVETVSVDVIPATVSEDDGVLQDAVRIFRSDVDGPYDTITNQSGSVTTPTNIVDNNVVISQIAFANQVSRITDLNVTLSIEHEAIPDLDVFLISPSGTRIELFTDLSSNGSNLTNTIFDDEAATRIVDGEAPYTGRFIPERALSGFDGENPSGLWSLEVIDDSRGDSGRLLSWSIQMTTIGLAATQVTLTSSDTSEATVQTTVTIPANQAEVLVPLTAITDDVLDGPQDVTISVDSIGVTGLFLGSDNVVVTDGETIQISVNPTTISEVDGPGAATGTVTRTDGGSGALVVTLASSDTSELEVPTTVTIPDGELSATFPIDAVDDFDFDGTQEVTISASSPGYLAATSGIIQVTDQEPRLQLSTLSPIFGEDAGTITITIARIDADDLTVPQLVNLSSSDTSEVTVPATVEIPIGEVSTSFTATVHPDELLDGPQPVTITAVDANTANPVVNGTSLSLTVEDAETITITSDISSFAENAGVAVATATVTISAGGHTGPLFVNLINSDNSEISIPALVVIPEGETSATFVIDALDDVIIDPAQMVHITGQLDGFRDGVLNLVVNDHEPPIPTGPSTTTEDPTPTLSWAPIPGATRYDLWVNDTSRNIIQLFRSENLPAQTPFFSEDFSTATFDEARWLPGTSATFDGLAIGEAGAAAHLNGSESGIDRLETVAIDLTGQVGAKLKYSFQQTGRGNSPIDGDDLIFSYRDANGSWLELSRQAGVDNDMTSFADVEVNLPAEALHDDFALRIESFGRIVDGQLTADWFISRVSIGVDSADPAFIDDFESGEFVTSKWAQNSGATIDGLAITASAEDVSAHFTGSQNGRDRLESVAMDLSGRVGVQLTYSFQQTGRGSSPAAGNDLVITYRAANGDWLPLDRQSGLDADMNQFQTVVVQLPQDALHDNFAFRIEGLGPVDDGDPETPLAVADWFIDSVSLANYESFTPTQELGVGRYRFWVRAYDEFEQATAWSRGRDFLIRTRPQIVSPVDQRFVAADSFPEVSWTSVVDTARYDLWINNVTTGESQVIRESDLQTTSFASEMADLQGGTYRAWVRAIGPDGLTGFWSNSTTFTVLTTPQNVGPTGATFDRTPELRWDAVSGAASYYVWLTKRNPGGTPEVVLRDRFVTSTFRIPDTDLADGTYALWVQALAADGTASKWSPVTEFEIGGRPQIVSPGNNTLVSSTPTFVWTGITGTEFYEVWVDRIDVRQRQVIFDNTVEVASYTVNTALSSGTYRLWVRAISEMGERSAYSAPITFTVAAADRSDTLLNDAPKPVIAAISADTPDPVAPFADTYRPARAGVSGREMNPLAVSLEVKQDETVVAGIVAEEIVDSVMAELAVADWWAEDTVAAGDQQSDRTFAGAALGILASSTAIRRRRNNEETV